MPELPEVETTCRGIAPHLLQQTISNVIVRQPKLRWPITKNLKKHLTGQTIEQVERRGKYILIATSAGTLIIHLGMSGSLRICDQSSPSEKHDHFVLHLQSGQCLRLKDPRRFGAVLFTRNDPGTHKLLKDLGPEPLTRAFTGSTLFTQSRNKKVAIKQFIMNSKVVVGVGNIYASEALFLAGIHPQRVAGQISAERYQRLAKTIKQVLRAAIKQGGTTLRDFTGSDGTPGYFKQKLKVYGRATAPCPKCSRPIKQITQGQRSTFYCTRCQT